MAGKLHCPVSCGLHGRIKQREEGSAAPLNILEMLVPAHIQVACLVEHGASEEGKSVDSQRGGKGGGGIWRGVASTDSQRAEKETKEWG